MNSSADRESERAGLREPQMVRAGRGFARELSLLDFGGSSVGLKSDVDGWSNGWDHSGEKSNQTNRP